MAPLSRAGFLLLALAVAVSAGPAPVRPVRMAPIADFAAAHPGFRASLVSQINLAGALSAAPQLSLTPLLAPAPTPGDLWTPQASQFVGSLVASPAAAAEAAPQLAALVGPEAAAKLQAAAAAFAERRTADPALDAELERLSKGFDIRDLSAVEGFAASLYDNISRRPSDAGTSTVAVPDGPGRAPLVTLSRPGQKPAMSPAELAAYVEKNKEVSPRGLVRVAFASGDYRPEYREALRALKVNRVTIKNPSRAEIDRLAGDEHDFRLVSEKVRWVMTTRTMDQHMADLADNSKGGKGSNASQFRKSLEKARTLTVKGPSVLTVEDWEEWYKIYEQEVVGVDNATGRVGRRAVEQDMARKLGAEKLASEGWYGAFYYDAEGKMVGGDIYKALPERGLFVNGYAAYRASLKPFSPAVRAFDIGMALAAEKNQPLFSFGMDTNMGGYDYSLGLMANKAGFLLEPFPEGDVLLSSMIDDSPIASVVNGQGHTAGYGYFGVSDALKERYLAELEAGRPKPADQLLGRAFRRDGDTVRAQDGMTSAEATLYWHYQGTSPDSLRTPRGVRVERRRMTTPPSVATNP